MVDIKYIRIIAIILLFNAIGTACYFGVKSYTLYQKTAQDIEKIQDIISMEMIRITASDGTPLKGIFIVNPEQETWTNYSVPFLMICHGMSSENIGYVRMGYNYAKLGYAVFLPEFRGHGSNPAPTSLGYYEATDIIEWMDYFETQHSYINISASGIYGESMGGLYATQAYIHESLGKGRLKCLVEIVGPLNISREYDFLTNNVNALGDLPFTGFLEEKNPIVYGNETFPRNVLMIHGDQDAIVDYRCGVDFYHQIDPYENRSDVEFYLFSGESHGVAGSPFSINRTRYWLDYYVRNIEFTGTFTFESLPIDFSSASNGKDNLLISMIIIILIIPLALVVIKPNFMQKYLSKKEKTEFVHQNVSTEWNQKTKVLCAFGYIGTFFVSGVIALLISNYIVTELMLVSLTTILYLIIISKYRQKQFLHDYLVDQYKSELNIRNGFVWITAFVIGLGSYVLITSNTMVEDATFVPGARRSWWLVLLIAFLTTQLIINVIFIRSLLDKPIQGFINRLKEVLLSGILTAFGLVLFFVWSYDAIIKIPTWGINYTLSVIVAVLFGVFFLVSDLIIQISEYFTKSIIPGALAMAVIIPFFIGETSLIFFY